MSKVFTTGQRVFCKTPHYHYSGEEGDAHYYLKKDEIYTIWGFSSKTNMVTIREAFGTLCADRFVDAEKYLHKKEFESKMEDLIND